MGDMGALGEPVTQGRPECPECPHPGTSGVAPSLAGVGVPWDPQSEGDPDPAPQRGTAWRGLFSGKGWSSPRWGCENSKPLASCKHCLCPSGCIPAVVSAPPPPWSVPPPPVSALILVSALTPPETSLPFHQSLPDHCGICLV